LRKGGDNMPLVKILEHFPSTENYEVGEEYDITNPAALIAEGKVALVDQPETTSVEPVSTEPVTEGSQPEGAEATPVEETPAPVTPEESAPATVPTPETVPSEEAPVETPTETPTEKESVE